METRKFLHLSSQRSQPSPEADRTECRAAKVGLGGMLFSSKEREWKDLGLQGRMKKWWAARPRRKRSGGRARCTGAVASLGPRGSVWWWTVTILWFCYEDAQWLQISRTLTLLCKLNWVCSILRGLFLSWGILKAPPCSSATWSPLSRGFIPTQIDHT